MLYVMFEEHKTWRYFSLYAFRLCLNNIYIFQINLADEEPPGLTAFFDFWYGADDDCGGDGGKDGNGNGASTVEETNNFGGTGEGVDDDDKVGKENGASTVEETGTFAGTGASESVQSDKIQFWHRYCLG